MSTRRQYATIEQLEEFADITVNDNDEATDRLNKAEEIIDAYVGAQPKHITWISRGLATGGTTTTVVDDSGDSPFDDYDDDFWTYCEVQILSGSAKGEKRIVSSYDKSANTVTVDTAFSAAISSGDAYTIKQLGKFPRYHDVELIPNDSNSDSTYYKYIPEAVTRATVAQVAYMIEKGEEFFAGEVDKQSETHLGYSYTLDTPSAKRMISPQARQLLRGIYNRKGNLIA